MKNVNQNDRTSGLYKDAFILTVSTLLTKIIGVFFKIPLSYILGDEGLGYFNTAYSIYVFFYALCTAGVPKAITLIITKQSEGQNRNIAITKSSIKLFAIIGFILSAVMISVSPIISRIVKNERVIVPLLFIIPSLVFVSVSGVIRGYLATVNKLSSIAVSQLIEVVFKLVLGLALSVYALKLSLPLYYISGFAILGVSVGSVASCIYLYLKIPKINQGSRYVLSQKERKNITRDILKIAVPISVSASVINLTSLIDIGLIMRGLQRAGYTTTEATAMYGNYSTLVVPMLNLVISLITPFTVAALPRLSRLYMRNKREEYAKQMNTLIRSIMFFVTHTIFLLFLYSNEILDILFPSASSLIASPLLSCLAPAFLLLTLMTILNTAIEATGDVKTPLISLILVTVVKLFVSSLLISRSGLGMMGIPLGNIVAYFIGLTISVFRISTLRIMQGYILSVVRFCVLSLLSITASHALIYYVLPIPLSVFSFVISISLSTVLYILMNTFVDKDTFIELKKVILDKKHKTNLSNKTN